MSLAKESFVYLTTTGRTSGQPREIEIWFVIDRGAVYVLAEHGHNAHWVKNVLQNPRVRIRLAGHVLSATARVLDPTRDAEAFSRVQHLSREKYQWGEGLPVEICPDVMLDEIEPPLTPRQSR